MKNLKLKIRTIISAMLLVVAFMSCEPSKEKSVIVEYQGLKVSRQMGINDVYDTIRIYRAMSLKDSVCFTYTTLNGKFNNGDVVMSDNIR